MNDKKLSKQAFEQAEKELLDKKIKEVKGFITKTLEEIEKRKEQKARVEEELRILNKDLEDLRNGNFDKIKERKEKSSVANKVGVRLGDFVINTLYFNESSAYYNPSNFTNQNGCYDWKCYTTGTYITPSRIYYL